MSKQKIDQLKFANGRSVKRAKQDAKALSKQQSIPLSQALNEIAISYGNHPSWEAAMEHFNKILRTQEKLIANGKASSQWSGITPNNGEANMNNIQLTEANLAATNNAWRIDFNLKLEPNEHISQDFRFQIGQGDCEISNCQSIDAEAYKDYAHWKQQPLIIVLGLSSRGSEEAVVEFVGSFDDDGKFSIENEKQNRPKAMSGDIPASAVELFNRINEVIKDKQSSEWVEINKVLGYVGSTPPGIYGLVHALDLTGKSLDGHHLPVVIPEGVMSAA